ncbi:MAG: hypothetical protein FWB80_04855 [Defluviitaleaceae bacterium]|nr:hypothetical protein [Defluviitaleaceae bacterium]
MGALSTPTYVGFGSSSVGAQALGGTLTLASEADDYSFVVPRNGTITSFYARFTVMVAASISIGTLYAYAQLYSAPAGSSTYSPIAGTKIQLAPGIGIVAIGTIVRGSATGLSVPVTAGDQLLLVFSAQNSSVLSIIGSVNGFASAGVAIS